MDRGTFFQALPFLSPASSGSPWPPHRSGTTDTILKDHMLSVEPKNVGPACFAAHGVDPAMFRLDICTVEGQEKITSPDASSVSTSLSMSQSPKIPAQADGTSHETKNPTECLSVFLQIDRTFVFQVDLSQLRGVYLLEESATEKPTNESTHIPYFLLHFDSCSFRIFSEQANNTDFASLKAAAARLNKAAFQRVTTLYPVEYPLLQYSDYSGRSSNEFGQHGNSDYSHVEDNRHDKRGQADSVPSVTDNQVMRRVKQRKIALARSWDGLQSLQEVLDMPLEAVPDAHNLADTIGRILTATADELSSSYCPSIDLVRALQSCNDDIIHCEKELDNVFAAGFPPPRTKKRRGMNSSPATIPEVVENSKVLLETAQALLKKHKEGVKQRLGLSLLPIRD
jgi:hypothetical protein